jgi:hypothetical protein
MADHTNLSRIAKVDNVAIAAVREGLYITDAKLEAAAPVRRDSHSPAWRGEPARRRCLQGCGS